MRDGRTVSIGEHIHCDRIEMCEAGLHASFTPHDAKKYSPGNAVLTRVAIWGRIKLQKDKLVATDRRLLEEANHD